MNIFNSYEYNFNKKISNLNIFLFNANIICFIIIYYVIHYIIIRFKFKYYILNSNYFIF
jgi:hypothetical protein